MFRNVAVAAAISTALLATGASAGTVTLFKQNSNDTFDGGGKLHVNVSAPSANALAGGFRLKDQDQNPFVAWCLDILNDLSIPNSGRHYNVTDTPFAGVKNLLSDITLANVKGLFETAYKAVDLADNVQSAGFQLALWEVLYETESTFDLRDGAFKQTKSGTAQDDAEEAANGYLALLEGGVVTQSYAFTFYESKTNQHGDQLSQNLVSVSEVPLPAAAWMLGLGVAGLFGVRRLKKD